MALSNAEQTALLTLDPGYRNLGTVMDQVIAGCSCSGSLAKNKDEAIVEAAAAKKTALAPAIVSPWVSEMKKYSLDPALAFLADVLGSRIALCCGGLPPFIDDATAEATNKRTLDPGARKLAQAIDGLLSTCC